MMPNAYETLRRQLTQTRLPTELPVQRVVRAMEAMGYEHYHANGTSHHKFRKAGIPRPEVFVESHNQFGVEVAKRVAAIMREEGR